MRTLLSKNKNLKLSGSFKLGIVERGYDSNFALKSYNKTYESNSKMFSFVRLKRCISYTIYGIFSKIVHIENSIAIIYSYYP